MVCLKSSFILSAFICLCLVGSVISWAQDEPVDVAVAAQAYGKERTVQKAQPDGLIVCEAEEFQVQSSGWQAKNFGENYYAATFANCFLSRKGFLGAPADCDKSTATKTIEVPDAGRYLALVRYEAAYRFETRFSLLIEQAGTQKLLRNYGARDNLKIWAFSEKLKREVAWSWGAVENIVWEGHDAFVDLQPGIATLTLIADKQSGDAANRNIDLVMLTTDMEQVQQRIENEQYLPLDGMLTQSGDVWLRVTNVSDQPLKFSGVAHTNGGNWQEHSPYWVHIRNWPKIEISVDPGKTSDWTDVGHSMDSLNHGQWLWNGDQPFKAEFAVKNANGELESIAVFSGQGDLKLAADCNTRYTRRLRTEDQILFDLLGFLKSQPNRGKTPERTPIYAYTFEPSADAAHVAAVNEFKQMFGLTDSSSLSDSQRQYIDVRSVPTEKIAEYCQQLETDLANIAVVSLGDEISLPAPSGDEAQESFRQWLQSKSLKASDIDVAAGDDWNKISYDISEGKKEAHPGVYYWSKRYQYHYGIQEIKTRTDILRQMLPNAGIGANYSPHHPIDHLFLGEVFKWVSAFREEGMTMPWSEDYIWQVPVATSQMNEINFALFRAALRNKPDNKIHYYVMAHAPNNTPDMWRRLFIGALGGGTKIVNLFEFRPVHVSYTENHVDDSAMYAMVLKSFRELGTYEDIIQHGQVENGQAGIWFSETGDIWGDSHGSFAPAKRALFMAIRNQQTQLDVIVEADALDGMLDQYRALYLTDPHVSQAASQAIADWVERGGKLFATAGAGMFDETNRPNTVLRALFGVEPGTLDDPIEHRVTFIKQDLPFSQPLDLVIWQSADNVETTTPAIAVRWPFGITSGEPSARFSDGSPAVYTRQVGQGQTTFCGFLPGLSYYHPAIPRRPVDRGSNPDSMIHFLPTNFDRAAASLIGSITADLELPVRCSEPLVATSIIRSERGVAIPLVNWSGKPIESLQVEISATVPQTSIVLASGSPLTFNSDDPQKLQLEFQLDAADVLIFR